MRKIRESRESKLEVALCVYSSLTFTRWFYQGSSVSNCTHSPYSSHTHRLDVRANNAREFIYLIRMRTPISCVSRGNNFYTRVHLVVQIRHS